MWVLFALTSREFGSLHRTWKYYSYTIAIGSIVDAIRRSMIAVLGVVVVDIARSVHIPNVVAVRPISRTQKAVTRI